MIAIAILLSAVGAAEYRWQVDHAGNQVTLFSSSGDWIGAYLPSRDVFLPRDGSGYGSASIPPVPIPKEFWPISKAVGSDKPTGVVSDKIKGSPEYSGPTGAMSRQQAYAALGDAAAQFPSDSGKIWATVIGSKTSRKAVVEQLECEGQGKVIVKEFDRDEWPISADRFASLPAGDPVVLLTGAATKAGTAPAIWFQGDGNLDALRVGLVEALRKADPLFDPKKIPGPNNMPALDAWPVLQPIVLIFVVGCVLLPMLLVFMALVVFAVVRVLRKSES